MRLCFCVILFYIGYVFDCQATQPGFGCVVWDLGFYLDLIWLPTACFIGNRLYGDKYVVAWAFVMGGFVIGDMVVVEDFGFNCECYYMIWGDVVVIPKWVCVSVMFLASMIFIVITGYGYVSYSVFSFVDSYSSMLLFCLVIQVDLWTSGLTVFGFVVLYGFMLRVLIMYGYWLRNLWVPIH
eukprot:gene3016-1998_t